MCAIFFPVNPVGKAFFYLLFSIFIIYPLSADKIVTLSRQRKVRSYLFPEGTRLLLDNKKNLLWVKLSQKTNLENIAFPAGQLIHFYRNNSIKSFLPVENMKVKGILALSDDLEDTTVFLHPNGKVKQITLARHTRINGMLFHKRDKISFYSSGHVKKAVIFRSTRIHKMRIQAGKNFHQNWIEFHNNGKIKSFNVYTPIQIGKLPMAGKQKILCHRNEKLYRFRLSKPYQWNDTTLLLANRDIFLKDSGQLDWQQEQRSLQKLVLEEKGVLTADKQRKNIFHLVHQKAGYSLEISLKVFSYGNEFHLQLSDKTNIRKYHEFIEKKSDTFSMAGVLRTKTARDSFLRFECQLSPDGHRYQYQIKVFDRRKK